MTQTETEFHGTTKQRRVSLHQFSFSFRTNVSSICLLSKEANREMRQQTKTPCKAVESILLTGIICPKPRISVSRSFGITTRLNLCVKQRAPNVRVRPNNLCVGTNSLLSFLEQFGVRRKMKQVMVTSKTGLVLQVENNSRKHILAEEPRSYHDEKFAENVVDKGKIMHPFIPIKTTTFKC